MRTKCARNAQSVQPNAHPKFLNWAVMGHGPDKGANNGPNPPQTRQTRQTGHKPCRDDRKLAPLVREIGHGLNAQWQKTDRWNMGTKSGI
jgi:hypothetical protein